MKIIILGAGQVGGTLAENLVGENNDITIVDTNGDRLRVLQDKFDLRVVQGHGSHPRVLREAGADDADKRYGQHQIPREELLTVQPQNGGKGGKN